MTILFDVSRPRSILTYSGIDPDAPTANSVSSSSPASPALTYRFVPGGWFGDALPTGEFAVSVPGRRGILTHRGLVPYYLDNPANTLQYIRVMNSGKFRFAGSTTGTNSSSPSTYHQGVLECVLDPTSAATEWSRRSAGVGLFPVIYDQRKVLRITMNGDNTGTEGFGYVDPDTGELVPRARTQTPEDRIRLWGWTYLGDGLYIGQGKTGGVLFFDGEFYHLLQPSGEAYSTYVVATRDDEQVSVVAWHSGQPEGTVPTGISIWYGPLGGLYAMPIVNTNKYLQDGTLEIVSLS